MTYVAVIFQYLFFPGLVFAAVGGLVLSWVDRKVTARLQMRVGPPFLQPFYDIAKYMIKETTVPEGVYVPLFLGAPLLGMAAAGAASAVVWRAMLWPEKTFVGDLIVAVYLLAVPALAVILGAFASRNPLASVGGSREMILMIAYELPFVLSVFVPVLHTGSLRLGNLVLDPAVRRLSGVLALGVALLCMQAKLGLVPFDLAEAETELTGGALIEYAGPPLGFYKLTRAMMLLTGPAFLVTIFAGGAPWAGGAGALCAGLLKVAALVLMTTLIRNTAPRVRIDQALRWFWGPMTCLSLLAVLLAWKGW